LIGTRPTRKAAGDLLGAFADEREKASDTARGIRYIYRRRRGASWPTSEEYYVAAPAVVETKTRYTVPKFDAQWKAFHATQEAAQ
jgi:hypothetical protein